MKPPHDWVALLKTLFDWLKSHLVSTNLRTFLVAGTRVIAGSNPSIKQYYLRNVIDVSEYRLNRTLVTEVQFELDFDSKDFN